MLVKLDSSCQYYYLVQARSTQVKLVCHECHANRQPTLQQSNDTGFYNADHRYVVSSTCYSLQAYEEIQQVHAPVQRSVIVGSAT